MRDAACRYPIEASTLRHVEPKVAHVLSYFGNPVKNVMFDNRLSHNKKYSSSMSAGQRQSEPTGQGDILTDHYENQGNDKM